MMEKTNSGVIKPVVGKEEMPPSNRARKLESSEKSDFPSQRVRGICLKRSGQRGSISRLSVVSH